MAALGWDASDTATYPVVDDVAYTLFNAAYSSLPTYQQQVVNRAGLRALETLKSWGVFFEDALTVTPAPGSWTNWLWAEAVAQANVKREESSQTELRREAGIARQNAIQTYSFITTTDNTVGSLTLKEVRRFVATHMARMDNPPSIAIVDWAAQSVLNKVWNRKNWVFRRRPVTLTVATDETVTVSDSISLDAVNTFKLWYSDSDGQGIAITSCTADEMAMRKATLTDSGRPDVFRAHQEDGAWVWEFSPTPDQSYTLRTEVVVTGPPTITDETSTTPFAAYPAEFKPIILDLVLAEVMYKLGMNQSRLAVEQAEAALDELAPMYESIGKPVVRGSVVDVYQDRAFIASSDEGYFGR